MGEERGKGIRAREEEDTTDQDIYVLPIDNYVDIAKSNASVATSKSGILLLGEGQDEENSYIEREEDLRRLDAQIGRAAYIKNYILKTDK